MAVETFHKTTRSAIDAVRGDIDDYKYNCGENTYGRKISSRSYGVRGNMHVFYSKELNIIKVGELYRKIDILNNELEQLTKITTKDARKYNKYYDIKVEKNGEFAYQINYDKIQEIQKYLGYFCLYTNTDLSTDKILSIYKQRDIIEKTYDDVKNYIDMKRMRTHNDKTTNGKLFCVFIALIAINSIGEKVKDLNDKKGRRRITKQSLIQELEGIKIVSLTGGNHLMNSLTKDQKDILKVFRITEDELLSYTQVQPRPPLGEAQSAPSNSA